MPNSCVNLFLNDFFGKKEEPAADNALRLLCWNIRNPSIKTAMRQALWLKEQPFDVFALTETKDSVGCNYLEKYFRARKYHILFPKPEAGGYGAMVISRFPFNSGFLSWFGSARTNSICRENLEIVNTYVPNDRDKGKKEFLERLAGSLKNPPQPFIFCGDLNIIEPNHVPHYPIFEAWEYDFYRKMSELKLHDAFRAINPDAKEYSWFGRTGNGYRYDHCFVSGDLISNVRECYYLHGPRLKKLSDHSGLAVVISF